MLAAKPRGDTFVHNLKSCIKHAINMMLTPLTHDNISYDLINPRSMKNMLLCTIPSIKMTKLMLSNNNFSVYYLVC